MRLKGLLIESDIYHHVQRIQSYIWSGAKLGSNPEWRKDVPKELRQEYDAAVKLAKEASDRLEKIARKLK